MFKLARFAVRYPTTVAMAVLAVLLLGYISYQRLGMDLLPRLSHIVSLGNILKDDH